MSQVMGKILVGPIHFVKKTTMGINVNVKVSMLSVDDYLMAMI